MKYYIDKKTGIKIRVVINSMPKVQFRAKISNVDAKGLMTVEFSDKVVIPKNYT